MEVRGLDENGLHVAPSLHSRDRKSAMICGLDWAEP